MKPSPLLTLIVCAALLVAGIGAWVVQHPRGNTAQIVVSSTPIRLLVEPIAGPNAAIAQLIPSGQELHEYQARPEDVSTIAQAQLIFRNGADLDTALTDQLLAARSDQSPVRVITLADLLAERGQTLLSGAGEEPGTFETDPHLWVSPKNVLILIDPIRDALSAFDPLHAAEYRANADRFRQALQALDQDTSAVIAGFSSHEFIAFHNAFSYFARDYGLTELAVIEHTPGQAPSPQDLASIHELVETHVIRALFTEPQLESQLVEQLASDLGIKVAELDSMETVTSGDTYISVMRRNLATLESTLR